MRTFVALLRGVNVGKARRVPMAALRELLAALGYTNVATLLNSGNAVFRARSGTPRQHAQRIAAGLASSMKVEVPVVVLSAHELSAAVAENPIADAMVQAPRFLVTFAQTPEALASLSAIEPLVVPPERFAIGRHAAYLHCAAGILESRASAALLGAAGRQIVTTRNLATTLKLLALASKGVE